MKSAMLFSFVSTRPAILIFITREWRMRYRPFPPRRNGSKTSFLESSLFFFLLRRLSSLLHSSLEAVFPLASLLGKTCNWRMQVGEGDMCLWGLLPYPRKGIVWRDVFMFSSKMKRREIERHIKSFFTSSLCRNCLSRPFISSRSLVPLSGCMYHA